MLNRLGAGLIEHRRRGVTVRTYRDRRLHQIGHSPTLAESFGFRHVPQLYLLRKIACESVRWRRGEKEIRVEPRLRTDNAEASIDAAIQGLGIARLFSYHVARHVTDGKLVRVLPNSEREAVPVSLVYQINRLQSAGLKAFLAAARAALSDCPEL